MSTVRLSKETKDRLVRKIVEDTLEASSGELAERKATLAEKVHRLIYNNKKILDWVSRCPDAYISPKVGFEKDHVTFYVDGMRMYCWRFGSDVKLLSYPINTDNVGKFNEDNFPYYKEYQQLMKDLNKQEIERNRLTSEIKAILTPITTSKKLLEVWPECEEDLASVLPTINILPAVIVDDLNDKITALRGKSYGKKETK